MHGQADHLPRQPLGNRQAAGGGGVGEIAGLAVQRDRVIDRGRHPGGPAGGDLVGEDGQLFQQDRRLEGVEARIHADPDVVVLVLALAVDPQRSQQLGPPGIVGEDRAAVAVAAQRLGRKEAGGGPGGQGADRAAPVGGAEALGGVGQHHHALAPGDGGDGLVIGGMAEEVDRDHHPRLQAQSPGVADRRLQAGRVEGEVAGADIDEHRRRPGGRHHFGGGHEGEGGHEHRVARPDALGHQHQLQGVGAVGAAHALAGAAEGGEAALQLGDLRPHDEAAMAQHPLDRPGNPLAQAAALGVEIDEGDAAHQAISRDPPSADISSKPPPAAGR